MIAIGNLTGIGIEKTKQAINCLNDLISYKDSNGFPFPIITGYNLFNKLPIYDRVLIFSNLHETEGYKEDVLNDLSKIGYDPNFVLSSIREKLGFCLHNIRFKIRKDNGELYDGLKIIDTRNNKRINLDEYKLPLIHYPEFEDAVGYLLDEAEGWELNIPFKDKTNLMDITNLFLEKSSQYIYDERGKIVGEKLDHWRDAYQTPVLIIGESALKYADELKGFIPVTKIGLKENNNEISFIIHERLGLLKNLPHYLNLVRLGFCEEDCLANIPFVMEYVDKNDRYK